MHPSDLAINFMGRVIERLEETGHVGGQKLSAQMTKQLLDEVKAEMHLDAETWRKVMVIVNESLKYL